ncbi:hypothetical protein [Hwanghaeella sp.]|uniref:Bbp19 family protein n=1 Tax=Hwanghaeella sp. TaxID=2605943 RepID=UPI003CCC39BF
MTARDPSQAASDPEAIARVFARCFKGRDGERALTFLRRLTVERCLPATAPAEELRDAEGQRRLVKLIETLVQRGNEDE